LIVGTSCAGVSAAAEGDDEICGRGAAPNANLTGHTVLFEGSSTAATVDALYNTKTKNGIHISSNSWGPAVLLQVNKFFA